MSYPITISLSLALFLTACNTEGIEKPKELNIQENNTVTQVPISTTSVAKVPTTNVELPTTNVELPTTNVELPATNVELPATNVELPTAIDNRNIEGKYTLDIGQISFGGVQKNINSSNLVIEKLDDENFGFYYTVQVEDKVPDEYFGIFCYKDGKFVKKIIADGGDVSYYDNIELIKEPGILRLTVITDHGKRIITWNEANNMVPSEALLKAEKIYNEVVKDKYNKL